VAHAGSSLLLPIPRHAASNGHYECYQLLLPREREGRRQTDLYPCLALALRSGNKDFASRLIVDRQVEASEFSFFCATYDEPEALRHMLETNPGQDLETLCRWAGMSSCAGSLRVLLGYGAPLTPRSLLHASRDNQLDILDVALEHCKDWCPHLPSVAASAGNARFLMRVFDAGCPTWKTAQDGELLYSPNPILFLQQPVQLQRFPGETYERLVRRLHHERPPPVAVKDWSLVVSSDPVRSGPVLLLAAQMGAPLTHRMQRMLEDVRRRAQSLVLCFHRAARLSRGHGPAARKWDSMGGVPDEIVQTIATLARVSIVARDHVE
jgi:hypothetical protein